MTTLDDVQEKISNAQEKFSEIIEQLESFSKIKESLDSSDKGIKDASVKLEDLAKSLSKGAEALSNSAESMTSAINLLKDTDPALINENLNKVLDEIEKLRTQFADLGENHSATMTMLKQKLERIEKRKGILF